MDLIWLQIYFIATRKIVALFCGAVLKSDGLFDYILVEDLGLFFWFIVYLLDLLLLISFMLHFDLILVYDLFGFIRSGSSFLLILPFC